MKILAVVLSSLALVACGGGGDSSATAPSGNTAEGFWSGPASTGYTVSLAVLENGESWGIYSSGSTIYGALNGTATGNGTTFSATGTDYNFLSGAASSGSFTGTVAAKSKITATSNTGGTVSLAYQSDYDKTPSSANLAGSYTMSGRTGYYTFANTITIGSTGSFTVLDGGCTTTGTLSPRATGKNIYNFTATFAGACVFARMLALGLKSDKSDGMVIIGTKK